MCPGPTRTEAQVVSAGGHPLDVPSTAPGAGVATTLLQGTMAERLHFRPDDAPEDDGTATGTKALLRQALRATPGLPRPNLRSESMHEADGLPSSGRTTIVDARGLHHQLAFLPEAVGTTVDATETDAGTTTVGIETATVGDRTTVLAGSARATRPTAKDSARVRRALAGRTTTGRRAVPRGTRRARGGRKAGTHELPSETGAGASRGDPRDGRCFLP